MEMKRCYDKAIIRLSLLCSSLTKGRSWQEVTVSVSDSVVSGIVRFLE